MIALVLTLLGAPQLAPAPQALAALTRPLDGEEVFAYLDADELKVGGTYEFVVAVTLPDGFDASKAGSPAPFLQLDVPEGIALTERALITYKELADNEFLQMPFERLMEESEVAIPFKITAELAPGAAIGINVLAYVAGKKKGENSFFRRRLELPLYPGAEAVLGNDANSKWGNDKKLLQIGMRAAPFRLPNANGELVSSEAFLGKHNLIVTTYRAHW